MDGRTESLARSIMPRLTTLRGEENILQITARDALATVPLATTGKEN